MGMSAFLPGQAQPPKEQSLEVIDAAIKAGVNFFNTAEFYGTDGHNELLLGMNREEREWSRWGEEEESSLEVIDAAA